MVNEDQKHAWHLATMPSSHPAPFLLSALPVFLSWRSSCKKPSPRHWTHILYAAQDRSQRDDGRKQKMKALTRGSEGERVLERGVCEIEANEAAWWDERIRSHYGRANERKWSNHEASAGKKHPKDGRGREESGWWRESSNTNTLPASLKPGDLQIPQKEQCSSTRSYRIFTPYFKSRDGLITIIGSSRKHSRTSHIL